MKTLEEFVKEKRPFCDLFSDACFRLSSIEQLYNSSVGYLKQAEDASDLRLVLDLLLKARDKTDLLIFKIRDEINQHESAGSTS